MPIIAGGLAAIQNNKRTDLKFKIAPKGNLKRAPSGYEVNIESKLNDQLQGRKNLLQSGWARLKSIFTGSKSGKQKVVRNCPSSSQELEPVELSSKISKINMLCPLQ